MTLAARVCCYYRQPQGDWQACRVRTCMGYSYRRRLRLDVRFMAWLGKKVERLGWRMQR